MTDIITELAEYTKEVIASSFGQDLNLLVRPDTDYDSQFKAWDCDTQEWIMVNGWLFLIDELD